MSWYEILAGAMIHFLPLNQIFKGLLLSWNTFNFYWQKLQLLKCIEYRMHPLECMDATGVGIESDQSQSLPKNVLTIS